MHDLDYLLACVHSFREGKVSPKLELVNGMFIGSPLDRDRLAFIPLHLA